MDDEITRYNYTTRVENLLSALNRAAYNQIDQAGLLKAYFPYYMKMLEDIIYEYEEMYGV